MCVCGGICNNAQLRTYVPTHTVNRGPGRSSTITHKSSIVFCLRSTQRSLKCIMNSILAKSSFVSGCVFFRDNPSHPRSV